MVQKLALQSHIAARQAEDLRQDLARKIKPSEGPFLPGTRVFYWDKDISKVKDTGKWIKGRVLGQVGPMVTIETQGGVVRVNESKVRRDHDEWHDVPLPEELTTKEEKGSEPPDPTNDYWEQKGSTWIRHHVAPRAEMYVPELSEDGPDPTHLTSKRHTIAYDVKNPGDGVHVRDDWRDPHKRGIVPDIDLWTGETRFELDKSAVHKNTFISYQTNLVKNDFWIIEGKEKIDLLEIFSGHAGLSYWCSRAGLRVGSPIDLNTGYDLLKAPDRDRVWNIIVVQRPACVFLAPPCTAWSKMQDLRPPEAVYADRLATVPFLNFVRQVAEFQSNQGRFFMIENPSTSRIWDTKQFRAINHLPHASWENTDFCQYGMKDPSSGKPYRKRVSLLSNMPEHVTRRLFRTCPGTHEHERIEGSSPGFGSRTKLSQTYPASFCRTFAACLNHLREEEPTVYFNEQDEAFNLDLLEPLNTKDLADVSAYLAKPQKRNKALPNEFREKERCRKPIPIKDSRLWHLLRKFDTLPRYTEIVLTQDTGPYTEGLSNTVRRLRATLIPSHEFSDVVVLRGTFGVRVPWIYVDPDALVIIWKKGSAERHVWMGAVTAIKSTFDPTTYNLIILWNEDKRSITTGPPDEQAALPIDPPNNPPPPDDDPFQPDDDSMPSQSSGEGDPIDPDDNSMPSPPHSTHSSPQPSFADPDMPISSTSSSSEMEPRPPSPPDTEHPDDYGMEPVLQHTRPPTPEEAKPLKRQKPKPAREPEDKPTQGNMQSQRSTATSSWEQPSPPVGPPELPLAEPSADDAVPEEVPSEADSEATQYYEPHSDLYVDECYWTRMTAEEKIASNTASFTFPARTDGTAVDIGEVFWKRACGRKAGRRRQQQTCDSTANSSTRQNLMSTRVGRTTPFLTWSTYARPSTRILLQDDGY